MTWLNTEKFKSTRFSKTKLMNESGIITSKNDNDKDKPIKNLKSPPPQNPIYHKINEIVPAKTVKAIE